MPYLSSRPRYRGAALVGFVVLSMLPAACREAPQDATEVSIAEALAFEPLGRGRQARLDTTERVIREAAAWAAYQDSLRPLMPFKAVDFEREMVLLVALPVPTGGYDLRFEIVEQTEEGVTAHYRLFEPGSDCRVTMGESVVFEAVRVASLDASFHFEHERETLRCTDPR
jgi:hypothetical protein